MSDSTLDLSLAARYRTVWPALVTRIAAVLTGRTVRATALGRARWLRVTAAAILAPVPVLLIWTAWTVCAALFIVWPLAWLSMLPTRIAVRRGVTQIGVIYTLCWFGLLPLLGWLGWWAALVMASRDPRPAQPPAGMRSYDWPPVDET